MTTEHTETAQSRVEITTNAKGEAQVSVKVYIPASWDAPLTREGLGNQMADIATVAAATLPKFVPTPLAWWFQTCPQTQTS